MPDIESEFFSYLVDDTEHWNFREPMPDNLKCFSLYLVRGGEATHYCSLQASSAASFVKNIFLLPDGTEVTKQQCDLLESEEHNGEHCALRYIDPSDPAQDRHIGERFTVYADAADLPDAESGDYRDALHRALWDEAEDYAATNGGALDMAPKTDGLVSYYRLYETAAEKAQK